MLAGKSADAGLLIVHTGAGKGKTSAALGMVFRHIAYEYPVGIVQFIKAPDWETGEAILLRRFPDLVTLHVMGEGFTWDTQDRARDMAVARQAWDEVRRMIADPSYAMVIADELNIVLRYDYLPLGEVLAGLADRDPMKHVVVTGRNAPQPLIDMADLVTEMTQVKHPFRGGVKAQVGIEF